MRKLIVSYPTFFESLGSAPNCPRVSALSMRRLVFLLFCPFLAVLHAQFSPTGSMNTPRAEHTGTLLNNGLVLVTGGATHGGDGVGTATLNTAELYSPAAGTWRMTTFGMVRPRRSHSATLLLDGRVLLAGGDIDSSLSSAEIFDPLTQRFTATQAMSVARGQHQAVRLADGRVMVMGGRGPDGITLTNSCEIYDPTSSTWLTAADLPTGLIGHQALLLPDGRVIVLGGDAASPHAGVYAYSSGINSWQTLASLTTPRSGLTATLLPNGTILVAGGSADFSQSLNSAEIYDPSFPGGKTTPINPLIEAREAHSGVRLSSSQVLLVGGLARNSQGGFSCPTGAETFEPATGLSTSAGTLATSRCGTQVAIDLPSGQVLVAGGYLPNAMGTSTAELWNAARPPNPVILVHGYGSDPSAFGHMESLLAGEGLHVHSFDYSALTSIGNGPDHTIEEIAYRFGQFVDGVRASEHSSQVDVVAHSEGGSVARAWMVGLANSLWPLTWPYSGQIARLVTVGTPHYGQAIALKKPRSSQLQASELTYGSDFVWRLHDQWQQFQQGPLALGNDKLLFVAGTRGTGSSECEPLETPYRSLLKNSPCNDGLVDVDSAVLPTGSIANNIRYVPYQHCDGGFCEALGLNLGEVDITDSGHKTYQAVKQWILSSSVIAQCCGVDTIDYTPSFFTDLSKDEGFLLLRFVDAVSGRVVSPNLRSITFDPMPPRTPFGFGNVGSLTITKIPAPNTYDIVLTFAGYEPVRMRVPVEFNRPTVPPPVALTHK